MIGREKNPGESEVARLIEQSIAEDKRRDDMRQRQQDAARQVGSAKEILPFFGVCVESFRHQSMYLAKANFCFLHVTLQ